MTDETLFDERQAIDKPKRKKLRAATGTPIPAAQALVVQQPKSFLQVMAELAASPAVDTAKMRELAEIEREFVSKPAFNNAINEMTPHLPIIKKGGTIQLRGGGVLKFAKFEDIHKGLGKLLNEYGFTFWTEGHIHPTTGAFYVEVHLERGNYERRSVIPIPTSAASPAMNPQQAIGAALAYAKRYGITGILNLISEDTVDADIDAATEVVATFSGPQTKKALKAIDDNNVPSDLVKKHYLDKFGVTAIHELPANCFDDLMVSCKNYGERAKAAK